MASENEPAKLLLPYLQRADELQKHEPLVAYYCRLYAMERGLSIPQKERTPTTNSLFTSLIKQLEKDKKSLKLGSDDHLYLEGFAMNVFNKADKQDRSGRADLNTAKTFYAASVFFEILNQFGEVPPDLEQKQKYAAWKAADIRKALKEGRTPLPGPPGGEKDFSVPSSESGGENDFERRTDSFSRPSVDTDFQSRPRNEQPIKPTHGSDSSPHIYDTSSHQHEANIAPSPINGGAAPPPPPPIVPPSPSYPAKDYVQDFHQPPPTNDYVQDFHQPPPTNDYVQDFHQPPPTNLYENSQSHLYHQQPYHQENHLPMNYPPSHDVSPYSYPNFQSHPSFTENNIPSAPSHSPSFQHRMESSYPTLTAPNSAKYASSNEYDSSGRNTSIAENNASAAKTFHYDSNYMPSPDKIAEAHKAARFAVGALAFDDVPSAVDHLKKSLELLTIPSAGQ